MNGQKSVLDDIIAGQQLKISELKKYFQTLQDLSLSQPSDNSLKQKMRVAKGQILEESEKLAANLKKRRAMQDDKEEQGSSSAGVKSFVDKTVETQAAQQKSSETVEANGSSVILLIKSMEGNRKPIKYKLPWLKPLKGLIENYSERNDRHEFKFYYRLKVLQDDDTPYSLGMRRPNETYEIRSALHKDSVKIPKTKPHEATVIDLIRDEPPKPSNDAVSENTVQKNQPKSVPDNVVDDDDEVKIVSVSKRDQEDVTFRIIKASNEKEKAIKIRAKRGQRMGKVFDAYATISGQTKNRDKLRFAYELELLHGDDYVSDYQFSDYSIILCFATFGEYTQYRAKCKENLRLENGSKTAAPLVTNIYADVDGLQYEKEKRLKLELERRQEEERAKLLKQAAARNKNMAGMCFTAQEKPKALEYQKSMERLMDISDQMASQNNVQLLSTKDSSKESAYQKELELIKAEENSKKLQRQQQEIEKRKHQEMLKRQQEQKNQSNQEKMKLLTEQQIRVQLARAHDLMMRAEQMWAAEMQRYKNAEKHILEQRKQGKLLPYEAMRIEARQKVSLATQKNEEMRVKVANQRQALLTESEDLRKQAMLQQQEMEKRKHEENLKRQQQQQNQHLHYVQQQQRLDHDRRMMLKNMPLMQNATFYNSSINIGQNIHVPNIINPNIGVPLANTALLELNRKPSTNVIKPPVLSFNDENSLSEAEAQKKIVALLDKFNTEIPPGERIPTPKEMTVSLKEYQRVGVTWMKRMEETTEHKGGILSDEMGLGKTIQTIALILTCPKQQLKPDENWFTVEGKRRQKSIMDFDELMDSNDFHVVPPKKLIRVEDSDDEGAGPSRQSGKPKKTKSSERFLKTNLVVVPLTLMTQWKSELECMIKDEYQLSILLYHTDYMTPGEKKMYDQNPELLLKFDVILVTYGTLSNQFKYPKEEKKSILNGGGRHLLKQAGCLYQIKYLRIILDEAHVIKNRDAICSVCVTMLQSSRRWCLTGTALQNSTDDLYSLFRFIRLKPYDDWKRFRMDLSINPTQADMKKMHESGIKFNRDDRLKKLQAILKCVLLRRTKESRLDENSKEPIIKLVKKHFLDDKIEFSQAEKELYDAFEAKNIKRFKEIEHELHKHYQSILTMLLRMRQMVLHHLLVTNGVDLINKMMKEDQKTIKSLLKEMKSDVLERIAKMIKARDYPECAICLDVLDGPLSTQCGHVFCSECITNYCKMKERRDDLVGCPQCRKDTSSEELVPLVAVQKHLKLSGNDADDSLELAMQDRTAAKERMKDWQLSTKINRLVEILKETKEKNPGEKTIVFCSFTKMLDFVQAALRDNDIDYVRLDGTMNMNERAAACDTLRNSKIVNIMLVSMKCGSVGLNLTCANRVVILDLWWNSAVEKQAIDRVHRIGQEKDVYVTRIVIPDTIEDRIMTLQQQKEALIAAALSDDGAKSVTRLSKNDLIFLFRGGSANRHNITETGAPNGVNIF